MSSYNKCLRGRIFFSKRAQCKNLKKRTVYLANQEKIKCRVTQFSNISQSNCDRPWPLQCVMSNLNMQIKSQCRISHLMAFIMFAISVTVYKIFTVKICVTLTLTFRISKGQTQIQHSKANRRPFCVGNSNICPIFTVYEIFTVKICMALTLAFRTCQCQM